jgi:AcrR family transcriptional regulator
MKISNERIGIRRAPRQERARHTVDAVLQAVERVLLREGADALTTNRIADVAGVSIGSVYQYFPDKRSIFTALHQRHAEQVRVVIEQTMAQHAGTSIEDFSCALVQALIDVHGADPRLHEITTEVVPESTLGFRRALQATFETVIATLDPKPRGSQMLAVLPYLVEALVHGGTAQRPPAVTPDDLKVEAVRAVRAYLGALHPESAGLV